MAASTCLPETLLARLRPLLQQAAPRSEIWAFGSRVNGDAHPGSDLDLALRKVPPGESPSRIAARLRSLLADSDLPVAVDVLDWSTLPDPMRAEIEKRHLVLQASPHAP
jgi:predicted nucleotidyltransferase